MRIPTTVAVVKAHLRVTLWVQPAIAAALGILLGFVMPYVDRSLQRSGHPWFLFFSGGAESAREVASTVASSMLSFTATVFSITVLVLQLASQQFSPRVVTTFLRERTTKLALAVFVGTFVYAVMVLVNIRSTDESTFVPAASVTLAFVLVLVSLGVFVAYIHRMAHAVRAIDLMTSVGAETRRSIDRMYPEEGEDEPGGESRLPDAPPDLVVSNESEPGVLTTVDEPALLELASRTDAIVALVPRVGAFVPIGAPLFRVWGADPPSPDDLRRALALEEERTPEQDPALGFRQLVDIAQRALSPGVNDPTTAVQALDQLHDLLRRLCVRRFPSPVRAGSDGKVRLVLPRPAFEEYVDLAFDEIRDAGIGQLQVRRKMRLAMEDCSGVCGPARSAVFRRHLAALEEAERARPPGT